ncbi:nitroreductase family protein [Scardovia inopinata]|nr:nitroreductase family protein [Scardovia inopinata]
MSTSVMSMQEAMKERHRVRKFTDRKIPASLVEKLQARAEENNEKYGLSIRLVLNNPRGLTSLARLGSAKNAVNFFLLSGPAAIGATELDSRLGYAGADLILYARSLGLDTWWCGGLFSKKEARRITGPDFTSNGIIVIGYGLTHGSNHKSKSAEEISSYQGQAPQWFTRGVEALLLAPTAFNKQPFTVTGEGQTVSLTSGGGIYSGINLGIGRYFFELGAGKDNFRWA